MARGYATHSQSVPWPEGTRPTARAYHGQRVRNPQPERIMARGYATRSQSVSWPESTRPAARAYHGLSARSSHSNSQAMPWQPERIMANCQNYPDKAWAYHEQMVHDPQPERIMALVLDQVIATARLCHGSQSVSWLIVKIIPTRPGDPGSLGIARGGGPQSIPWLLY
jgi:hypothetical protein